MKKCYCVLIALLACLTGCMPVDSLNPLYTGKDTFFDESLLGTWIGPDNGEEGGLEFSRLNENGKEAYKLTMTDKKDSGECDRTVYYGHLVKLGDRLFMDVVPEKWEARNDSYSLQVKSSKTGTGLEPRLLRLGMSAYLEFGDGSLENNGKIDAHLRRAHWFIKITRNGNNLQLDLSDDDAFKKALEKGSTRLPNILLGPGKNKDVLITATTAELQKFVSEHADDETFFTTHGDPLHRKESK
jgi:hypothetical protein